MGIQLSDLVENIVGKGEIARYEQFLLFPQCFQKLSVVDASKRVSMEKRENIISVILQRPVHISMLYSSFFLPVLQKLSFPSYWLLSHIPTMETFFFATMHHT